MQLYERDGVPKNNANFDSFLYDFFKKKQKRKTYSVEVQKEVTKKNDKTKSKPNQNRNF